MRPSGCQSEYGLSPEGCVIIGLIGMSGAGKSAWASRLADAGFTWIHCDELIADRLRAEYELGAGSVYDLGDWMGLPYEPRYAAREALYLAHETAVLRELAATLAGQPPATQIVIDTTGSAIYADPAVLGRIRQIATLIYLAVAPDQHAQLVAAYQARPRPVIWGGHYQPQPGEPPEAALARCYPLLLAERERQYARLAHATLAASQHADPAFTTEDLLRYAETGTR